MLAQLGYNLCNQHPHYKVTADILITMDKVNTEAVSLLALAGFQDKHRFKLSVIVSAYHTVILF